MCKIDSSWEAACMHRALILVLWDDREGWDGGWGVRQAQREGVEVYIQLICFTVQQKHNIVKQLHSKKRFILFREVIDSK